MDPYYARPEVSNSDLSELKKYFQCRQQVGDMQAAYRFGTLVDAIITEPEKVNWFLRTVDEYTYTEEEFAKAKLMRNAYMKDELCKQMNRLSQFQKIFRGRVELEYEGFAFSLMMRCKFDLWMQRLLHGGDIKSTAATTQKQFEEACYYFDYDRQRAVYMTLSGSQKDILIGISKVNHKVFKLPINAGDRFHKSGMEKFQRDAFRWWTFFGDGSTTKSLSVAHRQDEHIQEGLPLC